MTDPFGNYLCQKLLEHTNNEQRSKLVNNAAPHLVEIALNQHGTRALQKMIEFLSTPDQVCVLPSKYVYSFANNDVQIQTVINALRGKVVELIQDLNGNHVIQKCLNRLKPEDAQVILQTLQLRFHIINRLASLSSMLLAKIVSPLEPIAMAAVCSRDALTMLRPLSVLS